MTDRPLTLISQVLDRCEELSLKRTDAPETMKLTLQARFARGATVTSSRIALKDDIKAMRIDGMVELLRDSLEELAATVVE